MGMAFIGKWLAILWNVALEVAQAMITEQGLEWAINWSLGQDFFRYLRVKLWTSG